MKSIFYILLLTTLSLYAEAVDSTKTEEWGIEFNPIRAVFFHEDTSFSGTFTHFNNSESTEISIPWYYYSTDITSKDSESNYNSRSILVDVHYRKYFSPNTEGGYLGVFGRYAHLHGLDNETEKYRVLNKVGMGLEVGFKVKNIFDTSFYYGASISLGSYLTGEDNVFKSSRGGELPSFVFDDIRQIIDIELFKIGYAF